MELDPRQRVAAESAPNTVVTAGAGSGKTTVLAERFLWLVTERRAPIDSLLVLTFTRKAAAEMHERIHRRLSQSASPLAKAALERFDDAQISTLDSFCGQIVRNNCIHDAPHNAVLYGGNEHLFEFNEVYRVVMETGDGAPEGCGRRAASSTQSWGGPYG